MQYCSKCGNPQQSGAFCGQCGNPMGEHTAPTNPQQPNPQVEALKQQSQVYFQFFMRVLKNPSLSFQEPGQHSKHSLLNLLVLLLSMSFTVAMVIYSIANRFIKSIDLYYYPEFNISMFGVFFKTFLISLFLFALLYALVILAVSFATFVSGHGFQFKTMMEHAGSNASYFIIAFLAIGLLRFIGLLPTFSLIIFTVCFVFLTYVFPFYLLNRTILSTTPKLDPIITNIILMLALAFAFYLFSLMMADQMIAWVARNEWVQQILDEIGYLF